MKKQINGSYGVDCIIKIKHWKQASPHRSVGDPQIVAAAGGEAAAVVRWRTSWPVTSSVLTVARRLTGRIAASCTLAVEHKHHQASFVVGPLTWADKLGLDILRLGFETDPNGARYPAPHPDIGADPSATRSNDGLHRALQIGGRGLRPPQVEGVRTPPTGAHGPTPTAVPPSRARSRRSAEAVGWSGRSK